MYAGWPGSDAGLVQPLAEERKDAKLADLAVAQLVETAEARLHALTGLEAPEREVLRRVLPKVHLEECMDGDAVVVGDDVENVPARVRELGELSLDGDHAVAVEGLAVEMRAVVVGVVLLDCVVLMRLQRAQIDRELVLGHGVGG